MTKSELIEKMAKDAGITKTAAGKVLDSFTEGKIKAHNAVKFKAGKKLNDSV